MLKEAGFCTGFQVNRIAAEIPDYITHFSYLE